MGRRTHFDRHGNRIVITYQWDDNKKQLWHIGKAEAAPGWRSLGWQTEEGYRATTEKVTVGDRSLPITEARSEWSDRIVIMDGPPIGQHEFLRLPGTAYIVRNLHLAIDRVLNGPLQGAGLAYRETEPVLWVEPRGDYAQLSDSSGVLWIGAVDIDAIADKALAWVAAANQVGSDSP